MGKPSWCFQIESAFLKGVFTSMNRFMFLGMLIPVLR